MDLTMSIASMSVGLNMMTTQQELGISVLKMSMDSADESMDALLSLVSGSLDPNLGTQVDIAV